MRKLSTPFIECLKSGFLSALTQQVIADTDLDFQIRKDYLNIYFKGSSLLKLTEKGRGNYEVYIDSKFKGSLEVRDIVDKQSAQDFLSQIPQLKENIIRNGKNREREYEQLIIRANNCEKETNSEYFIVDRQYAVNKARYVYDLVGIFWDRNSRKKYQVVPLCFMEVKFAISQDIKNIHNQLNKYYEAICQRPKELAREFETIFKQKLELGLYDQKNRIEALKTLRFSEDVEQFQFILFLVDYNPNSIQFDLDKLLNLPFAKQIRVFYGGFAMWQQNTIPIDGNVRKSLDALVNQ